MLGKVYKVTARNFQSWKNFNLPVSGFTVIVGPSDRGKSAIIRALRGILRNEVGSNHISYGEKEASVTLEPENGETIQLTRNAKTTTYKIGEEEFSKLAGGIPQHIIDMRCDEVDINGIKLDPIFADQFDQQFMLTMSPSELNSIFGLFSSTEKLNAGKKAAAAKNVEFNSNARYLANEILESEGKVEDLRKLSELFVLLNDFINVIVEDIENCEVTIASLESLVSLKEFTKILSKTVALPIPATEELEKILTVGKMVATYRKKKEFVATLAHTTSIPISGADPLLHDLKVVQALSSLLTAKARTSRLSNTTTFVPSVEPLLKQAKLVSNLSSLMAVRRKITDLTPPSLSIGLWNKLEGDIEEISSVIKTINRYNKAVSEVAKFNSELKILKTEYKLVSERISELKTDGIECPECGHFFQLGENHGTH